MRALILSISSDIGVALARLWKEKGWDVTGTYRTFSPDVEALQKELKTPLISCDLSDIASTEKAAQTLSSSPWDILVLAPGTLEPVGDFKEVDFDQWEQGILVNLLRPLRFLHRLLPARNLSTALSQPAVLFFAGGGTNQATLHYSSYTLSKIALIKQSELLSAEIPDTRFVIVGPGYVQTKIHEPTYRDGPTMAKTSYRQTLDKLKRNECTPMESVVSCCTWALTSPCKGITGRNISTVFDAWGTPALESALEKDKDMYKLRRSGNSWRPS